MVNVAISLSYTWTHSSITSDYTTKWWMTTTTYSTLQSCSLEELISTKDWWVRVFTFVLALTIKVNARLALAFFYNTALLQ